MLLMGFRHSLGYLNNGQRLPSRPPVAGSRHPHQL